ncbi:MAG: hypothetical protein QOE93_303 [Actinomycetota bacterium]|jgi:hypothetical protein|nr:hypothetical protein [Actinomycetota bacterium]
MGHWDVVIRLDAATVLLQWATGGLLFLWVTSRRRLVGIGYGWLLRSVYAVIAAGAVVAGQLTEPVAVRDAGAALVAVAATVALGVSVVRRKSGVAGERALRERRAARVAAMLGDGDGPAAPQTRTGDTSTVPDRSNRHQLPVTVREFPPVLDLMAPAIGLVGLVAAAVDAGGPTLLALVRILAGTVFLGAVSDAMLLGHWYLVQPGLGREPLLELNRWLAWSWPLEVAALLWPTGMLSVLSGSIDDGWNGTLGWFWVACAVTTLVLTVVTRKALDEKSYSAVMAATGLLYLAILMAFGTDLVARAVLAG